MPSKHGDAREMESRFNNALAAALAAGEVNLVDVQLGGAASGYDWEGWFVTSNVQSAPSLGFASTPLAGASIVAAEGGNPAECISRLNNRLAASANTSVSKVVVAGAGDGPRYMAIGCGTTEAVPLTPLAVLTAILEHNVQLQGDATQVSATVVALDSPLYTLVPGITVFPGSPTVEVNGSITVQGTPGTNVLFELVRDRGVGETVLTHQEATIGGTTGDLATATLVSLDVDLVEGSTHTWSIRATGAAAITSPDPALILVEQLPSGTAVVIPSPPTSAVDLGTAADFAAFGGTGITTTGGSSIDGDIGVSPAVTSTAITGFALVLDGSGQFSTSTQVHPSVPTGQLGHVFAFDYAPPTPAKVNQATLDMITAYNDAAGRPPNTTAAGADIGGTTLQAGAAGVHRFTGATSVGVGTPLTLHGTNPGDVIIIQIAGTFDVHADIILTGTLAGNPQNVFFAVAGQVTIFGGLTVNGEFLGQTGIAMQGGTTLNGRALAQTAVTLINNTIVEV